jgi:Glycosyl transferase family 2
MARIRIFLLTYRRPHLLRRALESLLRQSLTDWVCELHNDAPEDDSPKAILNELAPGDPRIEYHPHDRNWGAVATFNHAFAGGAEPYASILEDDNWWEADLIGELVHAIEQNPVATAAWANMRIWKEGSNGNWYDTGRCIWPASATAPRLFHWAQPLQFNDAIHSNGAMLIRSAKAPGLAVPSATPFDMMEALRERLIPHPLIFLPRALGNYALTTRTARSNDAVVWGQCKAMLGAAFLRHARMTPADIRRIWNGQRRLHPRSTGALFLAAALTGRLAFLRGANAPDWVLFSAHCARHPLRLWRVLKATREHPEVWRCLDAAVSARFAETRALGQPDVEPSGVASREEALQH